MTVSNNTIEMNFVSTFYLRRWPCHVCGGWTEKVGILCEGTETLDDGSSVKVRICETCLEGADGLSVDDRIDRFACGLEAQAQIVRSRIGRLKVPAYEQWKRRELRENVADFACNNSAEQTEVYEAVLADDAEFDKWLRRYEEHEAAWHRTQMADSDLPF